MRTNIGSGSGARAWVTSASRSSRALTLAASVVFAVSGVRQFTQVPDARAALSAPDQATRVTELRDGAWYFGTSFRRLTVWVVGNTFRLSRPASVDTVISLRGRWIVPPYGDAHTHNLDGEESARRVGAAYLHEGTFFVQVLWNSAAGARRAGPYVNQAGSVDVVYANAGITSTGGHGQLLYEGFAHGVFDYPRDPAQRAELVHSRRVVDDSYRLVDSLPDVARANWSDRPT